nr:TPA: hypothetical protein [Oryctes rhinoceros nudivirus]
MDVQTQARLLSTLHQNVLDLPAYFTAKGVRSEDDISDIINNLKRQIQQIATETSTVNQSYKEKVRALQLEVDFVKKLYINSKQSLKELDAYKNLYNTTLDELSECTIRYDKLRNTSSASQTELDNLRTQIRNYEGTIADLTKSMDSRMDAVKKNEAEQERSIAILTRYMRNFLKILYPNDDTTNLDAINEKVVSFLQESRESNKSIIKLKSDVMQLQQQLDTQNLEHANKLQTIIARCNEKIQEASNYVITNSKQYKTESFDVDLLTILSASLDPDGTWGPELNYEFGILPDDDSFDDLKIDNQGSITNNDSIEADMIEPDFTNIPPTPGKTLNLDELNYLSPPITPNQSMDQTPIAPKVSTPAPKDKRTSPFDSKVGKSKKKNKLR